MTFGSLAAVFVTVGWLVLVWWRGCRPYVTDLCGIWYFYGVAPVVVAWGLWLATRQLRIVAGVMAMLILGFLILAFMALTHLH